MADRTMPNVMRLFVGVLGAAMVLLVLLSASRGSDAQATSVVINELQPRNSTTIVDGQGDSEDWIELHNPTGDAIDMTGWRIDDSGAQWPIPAGTIIQANGYLLIWASDKGDPGDLDFPGPFGELHANFQLNGTTDTITLRNASLAVVDAVSYDLPFEQDESYGRNPSGMFALFLPGTVTPLAPNGAAATPTPTPQPASPSIVINEAMQSNSTFLTDGNGDFEDWFELFNPTCTTVDLGGWSVRDSSETWQLPAGTVMSPGDVLFLWASNKGDPDDAEFPGPPGELHTNFQLAAAGETVYLLDNLGRLVASETLPPASPDESHARIAAGSFTVYTGGSITPGGVNPGQAVPTCVPRPTLTPGGPTVTPTPTPVIPPLSTVDPTTTPTAGPTPPAAGCATAVRINEVQTGNDDTIADGDGDFADWIELYNPSDAAADLGGWRITDSGSTFTVPAGTSIGGGAFLLIWASDKGAPDDPGFPGPPGEVHANFRLSGDGETVSLFDASRCLVDRLPVPALADGESFGVLGDGSTGGFDAGFATPLAPNGRQRPAAQSTCYAPDSPIRIERLVSRNDGLLLDGDGDAGDFIELRNTGASPVDLTAWQIHDESDRSVLPRGTVLAGGDTVVLWASGKGFVLDEGYPGPVGEIHLTFRLAGEGEQLTLTEPSECIVERFVYPELQDNEAYGFVGAGAERVVSSPGATTGPCAAPGSVLISAISPRNDVGRADSQGDYGDWLELRNTTDEPIDISGWVLSDEGASWIVPDGVVIVPGADRVVWADEKPGGSGDGELHASFRLAGEGETLTLTSGVDCPVDEVLYPEVDDDQVYRRSVAGAAEVTGAAAPDEDVDESEESDEDESGASGLGGVTVVSSGCISISELMAKNDSTIETPDGDHEDWLELANAGDDPVDLSSWSIGDEESSWAFPDGTVIEAGGVLLVWADEVDSDDPDDLRTNFKLASEGEPITLLDADGEVVALLSGYPELDDDEAFGVDDTGAYVFIEAGDATPGEGPIPGECAFGLTVGSGDAAAKADDESGEDDADADRSDDAGKVAEAGSEESAGTADEDLARTGPDTGNQAVVGQMLLISGATLVAIATITRRRSALH